MGYGANDAVENGDDECREHCAKLIAQNAAQLVAAGDLGRGDAIKGVTDWLRREGEAQADPSGTASIENTFPAPSKLAPRHQVAAIAAELLEAARQAADTL